MPRSCRGPSCPILDRVYNPSEWNARPFAMSTRAHNPVKFGGQHEADVEQCVTAIVVNSVGHSFASLWRVCACVCSARMGRGIWNKLEESWMAGAYKETFSFHPEPWYSAPGSSESENGSLLIAKTKNAMRYCGKDLKGRDNSFARINKTLIEVKTMAKHPQRMWVAPNHWRAEQRVWTWVLPFVVIIIIFNNMLYTKVC